MPLELRRGVKAPEVASQTATPAAGERLLYPKSDGWYEKTSAGVETKVGPSAGGGGGTAAPAYDLNQDWSSTNPTTPTAGVTIFARHKARRLLGFRGPSGQDTGVQPALFSNRAGRWAAVNNATTPFSEQVVFTAIAAPSAVAMASTNFYTSMVRNRFTSAATANAAAGIRSATAQWFLSSTANMGGFFQVVRFGINSTSATSKFFCGMSTTTTALAPATEPTALLNLFGLAFNSTDTNFQIIYNGASGTATKVDLGASFPARTAATNFYEFRLFAASAGGVSVSWSLERLNDGLLTQGTITDAAKMPALGALLAHHVNFVNTTAVAVSLDLQSIYIENDN